MLEMLFGVTTLVVLLAGFLVVSRLHQLSAAQREVLEVLTQDLETKHREMLSDLQQGMSKQTETLQQSLVQHGSLLNARRYVTQTLHHAGRAIQA